MSQAEAQRWKEKYLQSLERQEQLEERWEARLDLLRRSLVRSSFAVEGGDPAVEHCMQQLRAVLREGDLDEGLSALVPRLQSAVLKGERERQARIERLALVLERLVEQLLALAPPSEVRKSLKRFARQAGKRAAQASELPKLLGELAGLQAQALAAQDSDGKRADGLLQRLFGNGQRGEVPRDAQVPAPQAVEVETVQSVHPTLQQGEFDWSLLLDQLPMPATLFEAAESIAASEMKQHPNENEIPHDIAYALPAMSEQAYSAIAEHVQVTLFGLLDDLQLPESHTPQAIELRGRIQRGLNWYELVPVLDDLAVLMRAATGEGLREFERYLQTLNERLSTMQDNLSAAHEGAAQSQKAARRLDDELRQHVGGLQHSVLEASDLASLKQVVRTRLDGLLQTADAYQQQCSRHESQLDERLKQLLGRVTSLEQAASGLRQRLEEQRQLALVDTLTELPNRAAWDERLGVELARRQRYGGELLLAIVDVDHFKRINDGFGHLAGDRVLKIIAGELRKRLRKTDFIARFGGEEFALLLPHTALTAGVNLLNELREGIERCPFHFKGEPVTVTISAGLSAVSGGESAEQAFERADHALYAAKAAGRNRIELGLTEQV